MLMIKQAFSYHLNYIINLNEKLKLAKSVWLQVKSNRIQNKRNAREKLRIDPGPGTNETLTMIVTESFRRQYALLKSMRPCIQKRYVQHLSVLISVQLFTVINL